jgi:hypothetical protein
VILLNHIGCHTWVNSYLAGCEQHHLSCQGGVTSMAQSTLAP